MSEIPKRPLGRTGQEVTILGLGGVTYNLLSDDEAAAVVGRAIDLGITYIDTAHSYKESERKIGLVMPERRDEVYLATKSTARDRDTMMREVEESFRRLRTDRIDCVQLHDMKDEEHLAAVTAPDGALRAIEELRESGSVRFVGVTGHRDPDLLAKALREYPFDTVLCSLGAVHHAVRPFHDTVLPVARERGVGIVGMKVMAYGFLGHRPADALRFVAGLEGVTTALVGMDNIAQLEENVKIAREFSPLDEAQRDDLLTDAEAVYRKRRDEAWFVKLPGATA